MTIDEIKQRLGELKLQLPINQDALDNECRRQSWLLADVGELDVFATSLLKRKKDQLGRIRAGLYLDIRDAPDEFGVGKKPTGPIIDARIEEIDSYASTLNEVRDLEDVCDDIKSIRGVVDTRRSMLHELVKLFVYNYMSGPQDSTILRDSQARSALSVDKAERIRVLRSENAKRKAETED